MINYSAPLDELADPLPIEPLTQPFDVSIRPPGSKSITCRAYVLAALAEGESRIVRPLRAEDTDYLLDALVTLGAAARLDGDDVVITGVGGRFPRGGEVYLGDGGTPARFMIAAACLAAEPVVVDGSKRMRERPVAEGVEMLRQLGAKIEYVEGEGQLPVRVSPSEGFTGGELTIGKTASSQFISAILLVAPWLAAGVVLRTLKAATSATYIQLTLHVLHAWREDEKTGSSDFTWDECNGVLDPTISITNGPLSACEYRVESDASSAAYWFVAATINRRSRVSVVGLRSTPKQADLNVVRALCHANLIDLTLGTVQIGVEGCWIIERGRKTGQLKCDCAIFPDGALAIAMAAAMMKNSSHLTGLHTLRVKETDRIAALANELTKIGCTIETTDDSITIDPSTRHDNPVTIETYNDHRMAMSFAVLGLARPGISIANPKCVAKSYPTFWADFAKLYESRAGR